MYTLGIDLHKEFAFWSLLDPKGKLLWQKKLVTNLEELPSKASELPQPCQAVLEPVGCFALYADILKSKSISTHLAHPVKVKYIAESTNKNDKIDSVVLGQLLRTNFLPEAYLPSRKMRELRSFLCFRNQIVQTRTRAKNRMRMLLNRLGIKAKITDLFGKKGSIFLKGLNLSPLNGIQRDQLIQTVATANSQLKTIKAVLEKIAQSDDEVFRMRTIPNIGLVAALTIKAYVGDFNRFPNAQKLVAYAGLAPSVRQSGSSQKNGHITREGPGILRGALVQSAAGIKSTAGFLYTFYEKKKRKIGFKKARIVLAKKLLSIAYRVVMDKTVFNPNKYQEMGKTRAFSLAL